MVAASLIFLGLTAAVAQAKVQFLGVAMSGGDFGCTIDGSCPTGQVQLPLSSLGGGDGQAQMNHFIKDDGVNMFRLPVSWQFLSNNQPSGTLNAGNLGRYDQLMQACLGTGAYCMIDIHNFARWNGKIIGQGGPSDDDFASLWRQLATKYAANPKVVFELMNEPHDLDVNIWAQTCQKAVTAIRQAGATQQMVLLPGTNFDSATTLVSSGSADALMAVKNPDGSTDNLLLDIHKYLDVDNSGTHKECTTDNSAAFSDVAAYLRRVGRKGFVSETGASLDPSCMTAFCSQNRLINQNADVFVGLVGWAAGSFATSYVLSLTPAKSGSGFVDNALMKQCLLNTWLNSKDVAPAPVPSPAPTRSPAPSAPPLPTVVLPPGSVPPAPSSASSSSVLIVAPPRQSNPSAPSPGSGSGAGGADMPTAIVPSMVMGTGSGAGGGAGGPAAAGAPTTLLLAAGTPPSIHPYGVQPTSSAAPRNGSSPSRGPAKPAATTPTPAAAAASAWQPAAATSCLGLVAVLAVLFL